MFKNVTNFYLLNSRFRLNKKALVIYGSKNSYIKHIYFYFLQIYKQYTPESFYFFNQKRDSWESSKFYKFFNKRSHRVLK